MYGHVSVEAVCLQLHHVSYIAWDNVSNTLLLLSGQVYFTLWHDWMYRPMTVGAVWLQIHHATRSAWDTVNNIVNGPSVYFTLGNVFDCSWRCVFVFCYTLINVICSFEIAWYTGRKSYQVYLFAFCCVTSPIMIGLGSTGLAVWSTELPHLLSVVSRHL